MEEMATLQASVVNASRDINGTSSGDMLALLTNQGLGKVVAVNDLMDKFNDFQNTIGATEGVEGVQQKGKEAVDEKVKTFQVYKYIYMYIYR